MNGYEMEKRMERLEAIIAKLIREIERLKSFHAEA